VRQAWDTGMPQVKMEALDFVHSNSGAICHAGCEAETATIDLLESLDVKDNIFLSTQWLEARCCFSGFEIGINAETATQEYRGILVATNTGDDPLYQLEREEEPNLTFTQFAAKFASSALGKIFEDVFQGAYYEAYQALTNDERRRLLSLALEAEAMSFFTGWFLKELSKVGFGGSEHILSRIGSRIDPLSTCPQNSVESFIMAHEAWAQLSGQPIPYRDASSEDHLAWSVMGELVFWLNRKDTDSSGRVSFLCGELARHAEAVPDVLRQIARSHKGMGSAPAFRMLLAKHKDPIRSALHESLQREGPLTSVFQSSERDATERLHWTLSTLADVGDRTSIALLRSVTDDIEFGKDAINAIQQIERRSAYSA